MHRPTAMFTVVAWVHSRIRGRSGENAMMKRLVAIVVGLLVIALIGCNNPLISEDEESEDNGESEEQVERVSLEPEEAPTT